MANVCVVESVAEFQCCPVVVAFITLPHPPCDALLWSLHDSIFPVEARTHQPAPASLMFVAPAEGSNVSPLSSICRVFRVFGCLVHARRHSRTPTESGRANRDAVARRVGACGTDGAESRANKRVPVLVWPLRCARHAADDV